MTLSRRAVKQRLWNEVKGKYEWHDTVPCHSDLMAPLAIALREWRETRTTLSMSAAATKMGIDKSQLWDWENDAFCTRCLLGFRPPEHALWRWGFVTRCLLDDPPYFNERILRNAGYVPVPGRPTPRRLEGAA